MASAPHPTPDPPREGKGISRAPAAGGLIDRAGACVHLRRPRLPRPSGRHAGVGAAGERGAAGRRARSSITARAASSRPGRRSPTRWSSCGRARAASPIRAPPPPSFTTAWWLQPESLAVAALRSDGDQFAARARAVGRLLLQDLHVAGLVLGEGLRAADPSCRRARACRRRADPDSYEKAFLHCDVLVVGGGAAGLMARWRRGGQGHASCCARRTSASAAGCSPRTECSTSALGATGPPTSRRSWRRCRTFASCCAPRCSASTITAPMPRWSASTITSRCRRARAAPAALAASSPSDASLLPGAIERPLVFGDNDRPGVMLAGACATYLNRYAVAPGRRAVVFGHQRRDGTHGRRSACAGIAVEAVVDPRAGRSGKRRGRGQGRGRAVDRGRRGHVGARLRPMCARSR